MIKTKMNPIKFLLELFNRAGIKKLLFENKGIRQTIIKNTFWLALAEIITWILGLIMVIGMARVLGAAQYGKFAFALSFVSLFTAVADLGVSEIATRELARDKEVEKEYPNILSLKIILSFGTLILMIIASFLITKDLIVQKAIWFLALFILITNFFNTIYAFLRARQQMEHEARIKIFQAALIAGFGLLVLFLFPSVQNLSYSYLSANLIVLAFVFFFFRFQIHPLNLNFNRAVWKKFLKISWPLTFGLFLGWIYIYLDSIMMGYRSLMAETGWFNAVSKFAIAAVVPATLIARSFYPTLTKLSHSAKEKIQQVWNYHLASMIILALPLMVGGWALAPKIIAFFYGQEYLPATLALQLLMIVAGLSFFYYPFGLILVIANQQRKNFILILIGALINIILNLLLIKHFSLYGVASATVISTGVVFLLAIELSRRLTPVSPFNLKLLKVLTISLFSSLIMFLMIKQPLIYNLNILLVLVIGFLTYFCIVFPALYLAAGTPNLYSLSLFRTKKL